MGFNPHIWRRFALHLLVVLSGLTAGVTAQSSYDLCEIPCVEATYRDFCGSASCVFGFENEAQLADLCSMECQIALKRPEFRECIREFDPDREDIEQLARLFGDLSESVCSSRGFEIFDGDISIPVQPPAPAPVAAPLTPAPLDIPPSIPPSAAPAPVQVDQPTAEPAVAPVTRDVDVPSLAPQPDNIPADAPAPGPSVVPSPQIDSPPIPAPQPDNIPSDSPAPGPSIAPSPQVDSAPIPEPAAEPDAAIRIQQVGLPPAVSPTTAGSSDENSTRDEMPTETETSFVSAGPLPLGL